MKITIKPAAPPPAPVPVPASSLRAGDRFRVDNGSGTVFIRTMSALSSLTACMDPSDGWLGRLVSDLVIPCDNYGDPIIPPARAPEPVPLSSLAVGDVYTGASGDARGCYWMKLGPRDGGFDALRLIMTVPIGVGCIGWDYADTRVIKVEAELVIGGDR
jgi:hypothetical protein